MKGAALLALCGACAHALQKPPPIEAVAQAPSAAAPELLQRADAAWAQRKDPAQAAAAEDLYLQAARADPHQTEAFAGAIRAKAFRLGKEKDGDQRVRLAQSAVNAGQLCEENLPGAALCDYWLAAALGLQARERTATAHDALPHMTDLLRRAARSDDTVDHGGPHRLLAVVLLRAPGWPLGPGDAEGALPEAQAAVRIDPRHPPNQLALAEALRKNGQQERAREAYVEALRLSTETPARDDPEAAGWADEARAAIR